MPSFSSAAFTVLELARDLWDGALDLVFAPVCVACGEPVDTAAAERLVCGVCWLRCRPLPVPRCARCWSPVPPDREPSPVCRTCREWPAAVRAIRSAYAIGQVPRALVHALKYRGWTAVAAPMAARMAALELPGDVASEADLVIPVPASAARLRERGYNQAELLARGVAWFSGRTLAADLLRRTRQAGSQTALHPGERRANVARAFAVPPGRAAELRGEHVIVVDDVWTTGATSLACVSALLEAGARVASVVTFARVVPELERRVAPAPGVLPGP
ncbi:MAG TPA: double zinc ribbon domain-containing protein [Longimicrobium sp.]|nr:double zinc ribbon domain-containing protein [Longimicrobium sp.]